MGIPAMMVAALRHVSWVRVADVALQYGPDLIRKLKGGQGQQAPLPEKDAGKAVALLAGRVRELENALVEQHDLVVRQNGRIEQLEQIVKTLQARLNVAIIIGAIALVLLAGALLAVR